jgi:peptide/nickel transport system permease protein
MLESAQIWLTEAWWMWVPPGVLISITVLAFNFVGDGLRDALDPSLRR